MYNECYFRKQNQIIFTKFKFGKNERIISIHLQHDKKNAFRRSEKNNV
jgi:hypothetical protein